MEKATFVASLTIILAHNSQFAMGLLLGASGFQGVAFTMCEA